MNAGSSCALSSDLNLDGRVIFLFSLGSLREALGPHSYKTPSERWVLGSMCSRKMSLRNQAALIP